MIYYPAGHCVVFYNLEDRSQLFYEGMSVSHQVNGRERPSLLSLSVTTKSISLWLNALTLLLSLYSTRTATDARKC